VKKYLLPVLFIFLSFKVSAQVNPAVLTFKGTVLDSVTNKPLGYVTVALQDAKTQQSLKGGLTHDDGSFELQSPAGATYQLVFVSVGYKPKTVPVRDPASIGNILLSPAGKQLKEVAISGVRPIMKREIDRISYNVQADPDSKVETVLDIMRKVPLLSVDGADAIKLRGSIKYKILINNRESSLVAKDPSAILRSMPASNIERIEVITTPPAKYDAEGLAGIINIVTKRNTDEGYHADVAFFYNSVWGPEVTVTANVKKNKFGLSLFGLDDEGLPFIAGAGNSQTITGGPSIKQTAVNNTGFNNHYGNADLSYEIDSLNLLTGSLLIFEANNGLKSDLFSNTIATNGTIIQQYRQMGVTNNDGKGVDASLNYQLGFKKSKDQLLTLSYKYTYSPNNQNGDNRFSERLNDLQSVQPDFMQYNNAGSKEHTFQVDYAEPFKKLTLETGGKAILRNNFSNFQRSDLDSATNQYRVNPVYSDNFNYQQDVYSLYNSYELHFDKWAVKGGLRLEHTGIRANFTSANANVNQDYNNLIPVISIQHDFKSSSLNFGFTQRIQRPDIYQLNPFVDNSDPKFISTGNPGLRPELNNTFELNYSNFSASSFNAGLNYAFSNNSIQNVTNLQAVTAANGLKDTVSTTTFQNLGSNHSLGFNVSTNLAVTKRLNLNFNGQLTRVWLSGTFNGQAYKNTGFLGSGSGNASFKFDQGFRLSLEAAFLSGVVTLQGKTNNGVFTALIATKEFFDKRLVVGILTRNPYAKYFKLTTTTTTPQFTQSGYTENVYRSFAVRARYSFGRLKGGVKRNQHGIINDEIKQKDSKTGG
jgi:hypothetical protein